MPYICNENAFCKEHFSAKSVFCKEQISIKSVFLEEHMRSKYK